MSEPNELRKAKRPHSPPPAFTEKLPPHAEEAEQAVLGCVLLSPSACLDELDELGCQPEWFYDLRHRLLFQTLRAMHFRVPRVVVDIITVQAELRQAGTLDQAGGIGYVAGLPDTTPSAANLSYYAAIVAEKWQLRTIIQTCSDVIGRVYAFEGKVPELIEELQEGMGKLAELHRYKGELKIKTVLSDRVIPKLEAHYTRGRAQMNGIVTTGLEYLDKIFCGLGGDNGNYHVFAARPNVGKTSLVTGMALHAALDFEWTEEVSEEAQRTAEAAGLTVFTTEDGKRFVKRKGMPVGISSLEMSADSLGLKMLFQRARADLQLWRTGYATKKDFPPLITAAGQICTPDNILIDDTPRENIQSIKAKWRRWHRQYGIRFFMLDYIQLIKSASTRYRQDRVQEMEEISAELQALGKELNCPMAILAQLNRDFEKEPNRLPRLSDLKNCGAIEQDADSVTLLYKPAAKVMFKNEFTEEETFFRECMEAKFGENWRKWSGRPERVNALVEKNKHGPKGDAQLLFLKASTLFVDYDGWLKANGFKKASKGEESRYRGEGQGQLSGVDPEDVPPAREGSEP